MYCGDTSLLLLSSVCLLLLKLSKDLMVSNNRNRRGLFALKKRCTRCVITCVVRPVCICDRSQRRARTSKQSNGGVRRRRLVRLFGWPTRQTQRAGGAADSLLLGEAFRRSVPQITRSIACREKEAGQVARPVVRSSKSLRHRSVVARVFVLPEYGDHERIN